MVLLGPTKEIQRRYPRMGELAYQYIDRLSLLSRGIWTDPGAWKFFQLFTTNRYNHPVDTILEAQEKLQEAWWIETEDVAQECYLFLHRMKSCDKGALVYLTLYLAQWLDWRVFGRKEDNVETPEDYILPSEPDDLYLLIDNQLSLWERYIYYCISTGYEIKPLARFLNLKPIPFYKDINQIRSKYGSKKPGRIS